MTDPIDEPWEPRPGRRRRLRALRQGAPGGGRRRHPDRVHRPQPRRPGGPAAVRQRLVVQRRLLGRAAAPASRPPATRASLPDTRGHGRSGLPRAPGRGARTSPSTTSRCRASPGTSLAVLDDAGVRARLVVGHSMGVQTALEVLPPGARPGPRPGAGRRHLREPGQDVLRGRRSSTASSPSAPASSAGSPRSRAGVGHASAPRRSATSAPGWPGPPARRRPPQDLHPYLLHLKSTDPAVVVLMAGAMRAHSATDLLADDRGADAGRGRRRRRVHPRPLLGGDPPPGARAASSIAFADAGHTLPDRGARRAGRRHQRLRGAARPAQAKAARSRAPGDDRPAVTGPVSRRGGRGRRATASGAAR